MAQSVARFLADCARNLRVAADLYGHTSPHYQRLLAEYRARADALRCRSDLEEALLQAVLQVARERAGETTSGAAAGE